MKKFNIQFFYKDTPAINGDFPVYSAHRDEAMMKVSLMVKGHDDKITQIGNWDRFTATEIA